jgi:hypothetical protein
MYAVPHWAKDKEKSPCEEELCKKLLPIDYTRRNAPTDPE